MKRVTATAAVRAIPDGSNVILTDVAEDALTILRIHARKNAPPDCGAVAVAPLDA